VKRDSGDWKLAGGFGALLLLIVTVGVIGIFQIISLSQTVAELGQRYFPMQQAALGMRINNSLYAISIRNYIFWRKAKYLDAVGGAANQETVNNAVANFDRELRSYAAFAQTEQQKQWVGRLRALQQQLRSIGDQIINLANQFEQSAQDPARTELESGINKLLMAFESKLYNIDDFLDGHIHKANLEAVGRQLTQAERVRKQAIVFLGCSLFFGLFIGGQTAWLVYRNRRREKERRQELVRRMIKIEEEERENLSRQVHDQMGQDLSGLQIYLDLINKKLPAENVDIKKDIDESKKALSRLIEKSHNISELLRPPELQEIGLIDTLDSLILSYKHMTGLDIDYQKPKKALELPGEHSLFLYRLAQEGLTNIVKHARAKKVELKLELQDGIILLSIQDDGVGFDYKKDFLERPRRRKEDRLKLGLLGLKERAELLGGSMEITTASGQGTRLCVYLPVHKL
jgi:signal transduction histidine kinase